MTGHTENNKVSEMVLTTVATTITADGFNVVDFQG